jgi:hypothetical protein
LAGLAGGLAILSSQKSISVSLLAEVLERLAGAIGRVVVPSLLSLAVVIFAEKNSNKFVRKK